MIVRINGFEQFFKDNTVCNGEAFKIDCSNIKVPDISTVPVPEQYETKINYLVAKLDHINYSLMSKTEATEFLYRLSQDFARYGFLSAEDMISFVTLGAF